MAVHGGGRKVSRFHLRRRRQCAWTCPSSAGERARGAGEEALARLQLVPHPRRRAARRAAVRSDLRRLRLLPEFRHRGDRMRDQDGAQISIGQRQARTLSASSPSRAPSTAARWRHWRRPATRNISRASGRRSEGFDQVPFGDLEATKKAIGPQTARHSDRADPGRGRRAGAAAGLPARPAQALRRARPAADFRRGPDRLCPHRRLVRAISAAASRPTSWRLPRRSAADSRSAPASPPPKPPRA